MPLRQTPKGLFLHIRATPKAGRDEITGLAANATGQKALAVKVTAAPDKGAANRAVVEVLAKTMRVAKSSFELSAGETARDKTFAVLQNEAAVRAFVEGLKP